MLLPATGFVLAASLILGGGTRSGFLGDAVLQIRSVAALLVVLNRMFSPRVLRKPTSIQERLRFSSIFPRLNSACSRS